MYKKILFFVFIVSFFYSNAQDYLLPVRPSLDTALAPFYHGVASGDPLSDRVIIWTRVTTFTDTTADSIVIVDWQMATDTLFNHIVNSGTTTTDSSVDYTVKVDVTGLQPNTWYYYHFRAGGRHSITGRTRTAPVGDVDSLRFAVVACSNFQAGFFNVYKEVGNRNDIQAVFHLGDYYYEYKATGYGYAGDTSRLHDPGSHDAFTLSDYRMRHSQYKLDPDLRKCHQEYPFITIWDDHETANNSWYGGAQNHDEATEGDWFTRKDAGKKAYFEWMPIRAVAPNDDTIIHRTESWGNLIDFIMLDTRYEARDSSLGVGIPVNNAYMNDTNRVILGKEQLAWFESQLSNSTAHWRIIGNQIMIAPMVAFGLVLNGDQWDAYPAERRRVCNYIAQNGLHNIVFITGDIHSSWGNDLPHPDSTYNKNTGAGSVATEFVTTSITSPALNGVNVSPSVVQIFDPHVKYVETTLRGYLLLDINKARVQGDWIHVSTVMSKTYTASDDAYWMNLDGERFLRQASAPLGPNPGNPPLVAGSVAFPDTTGTVNGIKEVNNNMIIVACYPNPAENEIAIQYYLTEPAKVDLFITDMDGKTVYNQSVQQSQNGLYETKAYLDALAAGTYIVTISAGNKVYSKQIVKGK